VDTTPVPTPEVIGVLRELDPQGYAQKEVVV
jgi:hypothetical protein